MPLLGKKKPPPIRRLLLLPGLGDIHWVMLKLQSWLFRQGPGWQKPIVDIWDIDQRPRSLEFLRWIPFIRPGAYFTLDHRKTVEIREAFNGLYLTQNDGDAIFNFLGYDAFIGTNGNMRNGVPYYTILGGAEINYSYPLQLPEDPMGPSELEKGPYFVLCFSDFGMFGGPWIKNMPAEKVRALIGRLKNAFPKHRFLFTGCHWDHTFSKAVMQPWDIDLVGKTPLPAFLSLLQHSSGFIGWCGGNSILAQHLGVPTVVWWSRRYFPKHDRVGWETPHGRPVQLVLEVEDYHKHETYSQVSKFLEAADVARRRV